MSLSQPASAEVRKSYRSLQLTERDLGVLSYFKSVRFVETSHFAAALVPTIFPTEEKLRRRLRKLAVMRFLDRPARRISPTRSDDFTILGVRRRRGRPEDVWALAQRGADAIRLKGDWNRNNGRLRASAFQHPLMITRVYSTLRVAEEKGLIKVDHWLGENAWKGRIRVEGQTLPLVPDAVFLISDNRTEREATIFLETDNHTEPLRRNSMAQSSFLRKVRAYWHYWVEDLRPRKEAMLVFTIAKTRRRAEALRATAQHADAEGKGLNLFWFASEDAWTVDTPDRFLYEPMWTTGSGERRALFEI